jgi:hypothetical protein
MARAIAAALLTLVLLGAPLASAGCKEDLPAKQKGDLPAAIEKFAPLARSGNNQAPGAAGGKIFQRAQEESGKFQGRALPVQKPTATKP